MYVSSDLIFLLYDRLGVELVSRYVGIRPTVDAIVRTVCMMRCFRFIRYNDARFDACVGSV